MSSGASQIIKTYSFNAVDKQIAFSQPISFEGIKLITNVTDGVIIYQFNSAILGGSFGNNTLTLTYDTTAMSNTDRLMIVYEAPTENSLELNAITKLGEISAQTEGLATEESAQALYELLDEKLPRTGQTTVGVSVPVAIAKDQKPIADLEYSNTLTRASQEHRRDDISGYTLLGINIKGTFVGTVIPEGSYDGINFVTITVTTAALSTIAASFTAAGSWLADIGAFKVVRLRCSAYTSGVINITTRLSIANRPSILPYVNLINSIGTVSNVSTICCIAASVSLAVASNEDTAPGGGGGLIPIGGLRQDTPVVDDNLSGSGDLTYPKFSNVGATWTQPYFLIRDETFTAVANGTTQDVSLRSMKYFSLQVKYSGGAITSWNVVLEGCNNNANWTTIITHDTADLDGTTKVLATPFPCRYWRLRCTAIVLGGATNIGCYAVGHV